MRYVKKKSPLFPIHSCSNETRRRENLTQRHRHRKGSKNQSMMGRGRGRGGGRGRWGGGRFDAGHRPAAVPSGEPPQPPRRASGWGVAPPSRHLWVGSLCPGVTPADLSELFLRYGDVEDIAHVPGRSYAVVSFRREEDAVVALRGLQGVLVGGVPIRVEFAKGDRASGGSMDGKYTQYSDERHLVDHRRIQQPSPEKAIDEAKRNRSTEPSEVLWIGFPASLNVDEATLRKAFSPFGHIVKITVFPGRTYAFVRYATISAAYRAKEALQGKLFNNPRVSICFARNDGTTSEVGRTSSIAPYSPHLNPALRPSFGEQDFEAFPRRRPFDSPPRDFHMSSPPFGPKRLPRDVDDIGFSRSNYSQRGYGMEQGLAANSEPFRLRGLGPERRLSEDPYEQHKGNPDIRNDALWQNAPLKGHRRPLPLADSWDVDDSAYPLLKKLRTDQVPDAELPEYPFTESGLGNIDSGYSRFLHGLPEDSAYHRNSHPTPHDKIDPLKNLPLLADRYEPLRALDNFANGPGEMLRSTPEHCQPPLKGEWKWEGTIAKGGTPICRARCFPVGKVLDFMLPEILNCTARTSLDMLSKHYYQAASSWVVFFVPENDAEMTFYNEFMNYLSEKQRAAVCKVGERSTLFLVPPSEFSEKVLRVPGKVSISGVILKFQQPNSELSSPHHQLEVSEKIPSYFASRLDTDMISHDDPAAYRRFNPQDVRALPQGSDYLHSSTGSYTPGVTGFVPPYKPDGPGSHLPPKRPPPDSHRETANDQYQQVNALPSRWSNNMHVASPCSGNFSSLAQSASSHTSNSMQETYSFTRVPKGTMSSSVASEASNTISFPSVPLSQQEVRAQHTPSLPATLQPEQLAQLATLLAQQNQPGKEAVLPVESSNKQSNLQNINLHGHASMMDGSHAIHTFNLLPPVQPSVPQLPIRVPPATASVPPAPPVVSLPPMHVSVNPAYSSVPPSSSFAPPLPKGPPLQQQMSTAPSVQPVVGSAQQTSQQPSSQELDADPQKCLQATLQLAATLLQQIQQQAKSSGQQ